MEVRRKDCIKYPGFCLTPRSEKKWDTDKSPAEAQKNVCISELVFGKWVPQLLRTY